MKHMSLPKLHREDAPAIVQRMKLNPFLATALEEQVARVPGNPRWEQVLDDWASVLTLAPLLRETSDRVVPGLYSDADIAKFTQWNRARVDEMYAHLSGEQDTGAQLDPEDDAFAAHFRNQARFFQPFQASKKRATQFFRSRQDIQS